MNKLLKASLVFAVVCAFSACSKSGDRPVEAGTGNDKPGDLAVVTKKEATCTTTKVISKQVDGKAARYERIVISSYSATRSTKDKGMNVASDYTGKISNLTNALNADGTKTKTNEMKYSYVKKDNGLYQAKPGNIFYEKNNFVTKRTADEGFFFNDKDGKNVTTEEEKAINETEYYDDGVMTKERSYKENGILQPAFPYEFSEKDSKDGDFDVHVEELKAPFTEDGVTTESILKNCRSKKIN